MIGRGELTRPLWGTSPVMAGVWDIIVRAAHTRATVLITGESGTGKELAARAIHEQGSRTARPFVPVNCGAIPRHLLESELFGHARGAFTDAKGERVGLVESAADGTLFLDEVGDLPLDVQVSLLRLLQDREYRRVGESHLRRSDARVIAATNRDLERDVRDGRFRDDLFYRLHVIRVEMPPLRARGEDVRILADHLLDALAEKHRRDRPELTPAARALLASYAWPGNVRELENELERALVLSAPGERIGVDSLSPKLAAAVLAQRVDRPIAAVADSTPPLRAVSQEAERRLICETLRRCSGNRTHTARALGMSRQGLLKKMRRLAVV